MPWLGAILPLLMVAPGSVPDKPVWVGVWEGTVGTYPVRLCMDQWGDGPGRGAYYYLSALEPLSLTEDDDEIAWIEHGPDDPDARWAFTQQSEERLRGSWTKASRRLPFDLKPIAWTKGEWDGTCDSAAFMGPRLLPGTIATEPEDVGGWRYTRQIYSPPRQFKDEVSAESFTFTPEQPGDSKILEWLASHLPRGTMEDDATECIAGAVASVGADGYFGEFLYPIEVGRSFLTVYENSDTYCGGAHPNAFFQYKTFDRQSGQEINLARWLNDAGREHHPAENELDSYDTLLPALRKLIVKHQPQEGFPEADTHEPGPLDAECLEVAEEQEFWTFGFRREGMLFVPSVPHVATPCMGTFIVPWSELMPYLSAEGRAGVARLNGG